MEIKPNIWMAENGKQRYHSWSAPLQPHSLKSDYHESIPNSLGEGMGTAEAELLGQTLPTLAPSSHHLSFRHWVMPCSP